MASPQEMYGEFLKWHISQLVAPIEALFAASPLGFGGLHDDINFFAVRQSYQNLLKKQRPQTQCVPTNIYINEYTRLHYIMHGYKYTHIYTHKHKRDMNRQTQTHTSLAQPDRFFVFLCGGGKRIWGLTIEFACDEIPRFCGAFIAGDEPKKEC